NLPAELLSSLDPLFLIALQAGRDAFYDGVTIGLDKDRIPVILANIVLPTDATSQITRDLNLQIIKNQLGKSSLSTNDLLTTNPLNRFSAELPAGLLASALGLGGGCYTLDAACASSLYAIKLACEELVSYRADAVLTGGVSRPSSQFTQMGFSQLHALSPSGICRPFDQNADGLVVGEGAGIFMLKRLDDALKAGDKVYGVIRGIGLANDVGGSLLAPDSEGQLRAMRDAYRQAGWKPEDVQLIECHGTGTPKGDAIEIESLKKLWQGIQTDPGRCIIGSVKSNVGHLLTGAGAAGLMKLLFAIKNRVLPPEAGFNNASPLIELEKSPFAILKQSRPWQPLNGETPRRCALSAFGFGGIDGHVLIEEFIETKRVDDLIPKHAHEQISVPEIAIVAIETRVGNLENLTAFQEAVINCVPAKTPLPESRHPAAISEPWLAQGAFINELSITPGQFKISPKEIPEILPQQLLMLQTVDGALARLRSPKSETLRWGVYMGISLDFESTNFASRWAMKTDLQKNAISDQYADKISDAITPPLNNARTVGALGGIVASRIAREYHIGGPSHTFSGGENSGLVAFEAAARALQRHEIDTAITGAVDLAGDLRNLLATDALRPFSRRGGSVPFSEDADGSFPGEGAVAIVLKRKEDAIRDGDKIFAVIKGIGHANNPVFNSKVPAIDAYCRAMQQAWIESGLKPENAGLLETCGTCVPELDQIEAEALCRFMPARKADTEDLFKNNDQLCALSSTRMITGHIGSAAGLMSLAKAAICLYQQVLPAFKTLKKPIESLKKREDFFFTPSVPQFWLRNRIQGPRIAGVSSMSIDGSFYHAVLEGFENDGLLSEETRNADEKARIFPAGAPAESVFLIGGINACDVRERLAALRNLEADSLHQLAKDYWQHFPVTPYATTFAAIVADSLPELRRRAEVALHHLYNNEDKPIVAGPETNDRIFYNPKPCAVDGKIAFVFPGSGNHFLGMGVELGLTWAEHLRRLDSQYDLLAAQFAPARIVPWRLSYDQNWEEEAMRELIADHNSLVFSHVSCCAMVSDIVRSFGIEPELIMGYSLGETAGNFATRTWRERDEMVRRMRSSNLFTTELIGEYNSPRQHWGFDKTTNIEWLLGVISCPAREVEKLLPEFPHTYILIENTPDECVIGGNRPQVEKLAAKTGKTFFPLEGVSSVHCEAALPVAEDYRALHLYDCFPPAGKTFISSGQGTVFTPERNASADSIKAQCIGKIDFPKGVETAYREGARVFLEIGPKASMSRMITGILGTRPHFARSAMLYGQNQNSTLLRFIANCAAEGIRVDLAPLYRDRETLVTKTLSAKIPPITITTGHRIQLSETLFSQPAPVSSPTVPPPFFEPGLKAPAIQQISVPRLDEIKQSTTRQSLSLKSPPTTQQQTLPAKPESHVDTVIAEWMAAQKATADAHEVFLRLSNQIGQAQTMLLAQQLQLSQGLSDEQFEQLSMPQYYPQQTEAWQPTTNPKAGSPLKMPKPYTGKLFLDWKGSMEFATGKIGAALGEYFAPIDVFPTRVRLPDIPLNFVDRIVLVEGEKGSLGKGRVVTQHDVYPDAWYLDNNCMPTGLAVEAGQADLFLSAWLGIDFKTKGIAKYRLLDAVVTFHGSLPRPGDTINYDIRVDRFIRQADTYLFFFEFDGSIDGKHLITMRDGCAGFFTDKQLADGKGIVLTEDDLRQDLRPDLPGRENLPRMQREAFADNALASLRAGNLEAAFGSQFAGINIAPQTIPDGKMRMIDRITEINPTGGRFGLGQIKAEIDIPKNAWFLTQHFCDDQVMPGTLMYESCMQSLRVFLLRMGWVAQSDVCAFEPVLEVQSQLRCRGQVIPGVKQALYDISIKELGYDPEPYAIADALMFADGNRIVQVLNMSIRLSGATRESIESFWRSRKPGVNMAYTQAAPVATEVLPAIFTGQQILEYAIGKPSLCFGEQFKVFDKDRFLARLPNPPFLFVDRITMVDAEFMKIKTGGTVQGQFDIRPDHWFFRANRQTSIPFSVMLEFPLQVCGWYSCYMGSAATNSKDLHYRNLDGSATLYEDVNINSGTLTATVKSTKAANSAGMLIQSFDLLVTQAGRKIYEGQTTFGFFSKEALADQVGLRGVQTYEPSDTEKQRHVDFPLARVAPITPDDNTASSMNGLTLPGKCYLMLDQIELFIPDGGPAGAGFIRGTKTVDPSEWFFKAHFYQDPVIPGSLGLESFIQLMKAAAIYRWGTQLQDQKCHFEPMAINQRHIWSYRGQVIPRDKLVTVDACISRIDDADHLIVADGFLKVDGRIIYSMKDFALRVVIDN
ncbi:MAG: type I polyketide synthase, partial [Erysipelotrichia bacterium]|nr:type I polyketide synthase [Erysipelotrichia bacterium]